MRYRVERQYLTLGWLPIVETDLYQKASATCDALTEEYHCPVRILDTTRARENKDPVVLEMWP